MSQETTPEPYKIESTRAAERTLGKLSKLDRDLINRKIEGLATEPHPSGSKKIKGQVGTDRIRAGDFRVLYQVDDADRLVLIAALGNRKDIYRDL